MKTFLPYIFIIGLGFVVFFMTRNKSEIELISEVYSYSMQSQDSLKINYREDSVLYDLNKYYDGDVVYSGTYFTNSNLPYIELFYNKKNRNSIKKVYYKNGDLKFETYNLIIGEYILKEWDTLGNLVTDTIKKIIY